MSQSTGGVLGIGIIGCGRVVERRVAPAIGQSGNSTIAAFCSRDIAKARHFADVFGAPGAHMRVEDLLADGRVQAVYIATPNALHADLAVKCLRGGMHVLVDKPMALSAESAREMIAAAQLAGRRLGVLHQQRFHPVHLRILEQARSGRLGRIHFVRMQMGFWYGQAENWRLRRAESGGGAAMDLGPHALDVLLQLLGLPSAVDARTYNLHFKAEVEDFAAARLEFPGGAVALVDFSYCSHHYGGRIEVFGSEGTCLADGTLQQAESCRFWLRRGADAQPMEEWPNPSCFPLIIDDFASAVLEGREPTVSMHDGLAVMRVVDAIYLSAARGTPVTL